MRGRQGNGKSKGWCGDGAQHFESHSSMLRPRSGGVGGILFIKNEKGEGVGNNRGTRVGIVLGGLRGGPKVRGN